MKQEERKIFLTRANLQNCQTELKFPVCFQIEYIYFYMIIDFMQESLSGKFQEK